MSAGGQDMPGGKTRDQWTRQVAELRIKSEFLSSRQCPDHSGKWERGRCLQCEIETLTTEGRDWQENCGALIGLIVSERGCGPCWCNKSCGADCHMNDVIEILDSAQVGQK